MNLTARVKRLERHLEKTRPSVCGACGFPTKGGDTLMGTMVFRVPSPRVIGEPGAAEEQANELCPGCGRTLVYRMSVPRMLGVAG